MLILIVYPTINSLKNSDYSIRALIVAFAAVLPRVEAEPCKVDPDVRTEVGLDHSRSFLVAGLRDKLERFFVVEDVQLRSNKCRYKRQYSYINISIVYIITQCMQRRS